MSESNCGGVERYQALIAPTCLGGKGCDACRKKFKDPPAFSLGFVKRWRREAFSKMQGLVCGGGSKEISARVAKKRKLAKLKAEVEVLRKQLVYSCPHLLSDQRYEEFGRENTLGTYKSGMDYVISCRDCGVTLASWGD
jgi:hypothetical protein